MRVPCESWLTLSSPHTPVREGLERCWSGESGQVVPTTTGDVARGQPFAVARPSTEVVHRDKPSGEGVR